MSSKLTKITHTHQIAQSSATSAITEEESAQNQSFFTKKLAWRDEGVFQKQFAQYKQAKFSFSRQSQFNTIQDKKASLQKYAKQIIQKLQPHAKLLSRDTQSLYSAQKIELYLRFYNYLEQAVLLFKSNVKKYLKDIKALSNRELWAQLCNQRFQQQYKTDVPQQNVVKNIAKVFYGHLLTQKVIQKMMNFAENEQSLLLKHFALVQEIRDQALESLLSKGNALKLKAILACHSKLKQKLQKAMKDVQTQLQFWFKEKITYLQQYAHQILITIEKGLGDLVRLVLNTLQVPQQAPPKLEMQVLRRFIKEFTASKGNDLKKDAETYLESIKRYCSSAAEAVGTFLKEKILVKMMEVVRQWSSQHFTSQIEEGILKRLTDSDFAIVFGFTEGVYSKEYQQWFRGRSQKQKNLLYTKHLNIINYLSLVRPASVVTYYRTQETVPSKKFMFFMEKGDRNFVNFEGGYKFFTALEEKQKIRYVMDICESLIQLHYHGITHNDITFRNTICVGKRYKLIDLDVARMVDFPIDLSFYSQSEQEAIKMCKRQVIDSSMELYRNQLKEDGIISKTENKEASAVQNINRLAQYYFMRNDNPMRLLIESKLKESKKYFFRSEKFEILNSYEKLIVGKTDCNKFGLMLLKLMHYSSYFNLSSIESDVHELIKEFYIKPLDKIRYKDYLRRFRFSQESSAETNQEILKLIGKLMNPNLSKRIPMLLFALQFLEIFNIKEYGLEIDGRSFVGRDIAYDLFIKQFPNKLVQINESQRLLKELVKNRQYRDVGEVGKVFLQTLEDTKQHRKQIYSLLKFKKLNLRRPFEFDLLKIDKNKKVTLEKLFSFLNIKSRYIFRQVFQLLQKQAKLFICYVHMNKVVAFCEQPGCKRVWLCNICLKDCYSSNDENNRTSELEHAEYNQTSEKAYYHKILHLHSKSEVVCYVKHQNQELFGCRKCGEEIFCFQKLLEIKKIQPQKRLLLQKICLEQQCRKNPYFMNMQIESQHKLLIKVFYRTMLINAMNSVRSMKSSRRKQFINYIFSLKKQLNLWAGYMLLGVQEVSKIIANQQSIVVAKGIQNAIRDLPYLITIKDSKILDERRKYLKMISHPKLKIDDVFDGGEYIGFKIKQQFKQIIDRVQQAIESNKKERQCFNIGNNQLNSLYKEQVNKLNEQITRQFKVYKPSFVYQQPEKKEVVNETDSKFELWKDKRKGQPNRLENSNIISQIQSLQMGEIQVKSFKWPCPKQQKYQKQAAYIKFICLDTFCHQPFFCEKCLKSSIHQEKLNLANYEYNPNTAQKEEQDFFSLNKLEQQLSKKFQENQLKYFDAVKAEIAEKIEFLQNVIIKGYNDEDLIHKNTYELLRQAFQAGDQAKYAEYIFLIYQIANNLPNFLERIPFAFNSYLNILNLITEAVEKEVAKIKAIDHQNWNDILIDSQQMIKQYIQNKYKYVSNAQEAIPKRFGAISIRNALYPSQLQINGLEAVKSQEGFIQDLRIVQFNQLKKKLLREYYNLFEINYFLENFEPQTRFSFDRIALFKNLVILRIIDEPNMKYPLYLRSTTLQRIIANTELKELTLRCFNGFDSYCFNLLTLKSKALEALEINSYRQLSIQLQQRAGLFGQNSLNFMPFMLSGQPLTLQNYVQNKNFGINSGEYRINLSYSHYQQFEDTINKIYDFGSLIDISQQSIKSHYLSVTFNQLLTDESFESNNSKLHLSDLMRYFLYHLHIEANQTKKVPKILPIISERMKYLPNMMKLITQRSLFKGIVFLDLYGLVLEQTQRQEFGFFKTKFNEFIQSQPFLQNLRLKDSFGVPIKPILKILCRLKRVVFENVFFEGSSDKLDETESILEVVLLKNARVMGNTKNQDFASLLSKFCLKELRTLILNDCYSLEDTQFESFASTKLQYLSIRRCFGFTKDLLFFLKQTNNLKVIDVSYTQITQKDLKAQNLGRIKVIQKNWQNQFKECDLSEISRIAMRYNLTDIMRGRLGQSFLYDLESFTEVRFVKQIFQQKRTFDFLKPLAKLPSLQLIQFKKCLWREKNDFGELQFRNILKFPFIKQFERLKQLIIVGCELKNLNQNELRSYRYLRSLDLRYNRLQQLCELQFQQLISLDVSHNYIQIISLSYSKLTKLQKLNLLSNSFKDFPPHLYEFDKLRLLLTDRDVKQGFLKNEKSQENRTTKILVKEGSRKEFKGKYQKICYLFSKDEYLAQSVDWHIKLLKFNIQIDVKKGTGMISPQTKESYNINYNILHTHSTGKKEISMQNKNFQMRMFIKADTKTRVIFNEQAFKSYGLSQKKDFQKLINSQFKILVYKTVRFYAKLQKQPTWCCDQLEYVSQYENKSNYNFCLWCTKGTIYKSSEELIIKQKTIPFFITYLKTVQILKNENIFHLGLKEESFIQYLETGKDQVSNFKLLEMGFMLHLDLKSKQKTYSRKETNLHLQNHTFLKNLLNSKFTRQGVQYIKRLLSPHVGLASKPIDTKIYDSINKRLNERLQIVQESFSSWRISQSEEKPILKGKAQVQDGVWRIFQELRRYMMVSYEFQVFNCASLLVQALKNSKNPHKKEIATRIQQSLWQSEYHYLKSFKS